MNKGKFATRDSKFAMRDGKRVAIIRPSSPALALQIADIAVQNNDSELLQRLPVEVGEYTFIGYLEGMTPEMSLIQGRLPGILDEDGNITDDEVKPGDSFVNPDCLTKEKP